MDRNEKILTECEEAGIIGVLEFAQLDNKFREILNTQPESECYCTEDAICELCMIDEYESEQIQKDKDLIDDIDQEEALRKGNA